MSQKLSYFRLSLLSYLRDSHPHLANDAAFIATRGDAAAEAYYDTTGQKKRKFASAKE